MSVLSYTEERSLGSAALAWLNMALALLCGFTAGFLAVLCAGLLLVAASIATGSPRGGFDVSSPGDVFHFHVTPATKTVNYPQTCTVALGRRTCSRVTRTSLMPPDAGSLITAVALLSMIVPPAALVYGFGHAAACFAALARRRWFDRRTITHLRDFALGGLAFLAWWPLSLPLARSIGDISAIWLPRGAIRTPGTSGFDLGPVPTLLTVAYALLLAVITAVLAHARKVAEDHAQIV